MSNMIQYSDNGSTRTSISAPGVERSSSAVAATIPVTIWGGNGTWSASLNGNILQEAYGQGTNYPQYAALDLNSAYLRLVSDPTSGWGTSEILSPSFWSSGKYFQGNLDAPLTVLVSQSGPNLVTTISGSINGLAFQGSVSIAPPTGSSISATVAMSTYGTVPLDNRPGEAFKPVMLSSMHESPTIWDTQSAFVGLRTLDLPPDGLLLQSPLAATYFGLNGGTSIWKTNAPSVGITLDRPLSLTGYVTNSNDPNMDNVGMWAASDTILPSWSYSILAIAAR